MRSGDAQAACERPAACERRRGFTLVEMLIVVSICAMFVALAIPVYEKSLIRTRESVLRANLATIRKQIDEYVFDKQKGLQSLQELVAAGYLRAIPVDPMTGSNRSWKADPDEALQFPTQTEPGVFDVHSGSDRKALDGTRYSDW